MAHCLGGLWLALPAGSFDEFAVDEGRVDADCGNEVGGVDGAPAVLSELMSLNAMASHGTGEPGLSRDLGSDAGPWRRWTRSGSSCAAAPSAPRDSL